MTDFRMLGGGIVAVLGLTALWHGPLGGADRFARSVETSARAQLDRDEMTQVQAHLEHGPLTRRIILWGPADDFQRGEIVRRMLLLPGVGDAAWVSGTLPLEKQRLGALAAERRRAGSLAAEPQQ